MGRTGRLEGVIEGGGGDSDDLAELSLLRRKARAWDELERTVHGITMTRGNYIVCVTRGERWNYGYPTGNAPTLLSAVEKAMEGEEGGAHGPVR